MIVRGFHRTSRELATPRADCESPAVRSNAVSSLPQTGVDPRRRLRSIRR